MYRLKCFYYSNTLGEFYLILIFLLQKAVNSKQEELKQMYDKELSAAADTQPTVMVLNSNWRALIELNKLVSQEQLKKATADLSSQAGKLNEEYGLKLKELDEYKHRLRSKAVKWIVISQSVLIALSAALQLWLR